MVILSMKEGRKNVSEFLSIPIMIQTIIKYNRPNVIVKPVAVKLKKVIIFLTTVIYSLKSLLFIYKPAKVILGALLSIACAFQGFKVIFVY